MLDNESLAAILQGEERLAASFRDTTLAEAQEAAIDFYEAKPFGDEEEGRSQVVSPDVAEVVDYMTISVLRTCVSGDRVVEFEANEEAQVEAAAEATEAVSYAFMRQQDGYKVLTDWLQSGLIERIGVIKTACEEDTKKVRQQATVSEDEIAFLMENQDQGKLVAASDNGDGSFTIEIETEQKRHRYIDMPVPSEEFLFSARCRDVDDLGYKAHRIRKTLSELIEMGFDRETVESLPTDNNGQSLDSRATSRWDDESVSQQSSIPGLRQVWLLEEYVNIDMDDDGIAELIQVFRVGNVILATERVEENPFVVFTPFPRAHRMVGNSLADKVMDIQRVRSVILRQTLDGVYLTNNPRMWLPDECQNESTIEDLLTVRPGGIVRGKGSGGKPEPLYEPFDVQKGMGMLEFFIGERESRTGITRLNQGLDADALNKTATGTALMQAQGQQMEEYIARNFAEGMARLFMKKLRLMIAKGDPIAIKVEGSFKQADPKNWTEDMDVSIRVGLGSGRKEQRLQYRQKLLEIQQLGLQGGLIQPEHLYRNVAGMIRDAALGNPQDYWLDPKSPEGQQHAQEQAQKPNPEQAKAQAEQQMQQAKMQGEQQVAQIKLQMQQQEGQAKQSLATQQAQFEAQLASAKAQQEATLAQQKMAMESELAQQRMAMEAQINLHKASLAEKANEAKLATNRPGGSLAE